jgi:hypothetical protein
MKKAMLGAVGTLMIFAAIAQAERPPQLREDAKLVVTGTVKKITTKETAFGGDGIRTDYTLELLVAAVDQGEKVKAEETITLTWYHVTKRPTQAMPGAYGHSFSLQEKDKAKFWLMDRPAGEGEKVWEVIYNKDGLEKIAR